MSALHLVPRFLLPRCKRPLPRRRAPRRVIFFLQNQGFDPATCVPEGLKSDASLADVTLPEPIQCARTLQGQDQHHQRSAWSAYEPVAQRIFRRVGWVSRRHRNTARRRDD